MGTGSFVLSCITLRKPAKIVSRAVFRGESKMKILTFLILCFASVAFADDFKTIAWNCYTHYNRIVLAHRDQGGSRITVVAHDIIYMVAVVRSKHSTRE